MRICHVITRLIIGGAQENTVLTCRGLAERGHEVTLMTGTETGPEGSLWSTLADSRFITVPLEHMRRAVSPIKDFRAKSELRALFDLMRPDVVHTHSSKAGILGRRAAAEAGVPLIVHTIHGMSFNRTQSAPVQRAYRWMERRVARHTHAIITVADAMIEQSVAARIAPRERFVTIRSGMEVDQFAPDAESRRHKRRLWGASEDAIVIGTIARLFDNKGYDEIIRAMPEIVARCPSARFVWVGDGAQREAYRRRLESLGLLDRVFFAGLVAPRDVASHVRGFDLLVHASRWEGLPRAAVQALLCEVPVVSFDNDGAREVVIDGVTGRLVRYGDVPAMAAAVVELVGDAPARSRMGAAGRDRCRNEFDWRTMVKRIEEIYLEKLGCDACR
ncbi:MAG: glycosyltransferase family 4 protein [Phycisphaerales bacterium]|nr:glycosyltransferase family 4 protein [Phycisphaerales bacterium]